MVVMLVLSFFSWWYGRGWREVARSIKPRLDNVADTFSVSQLLRTLFAPWRRIITYPGSSLSARLKAWGDNVVSRTVGFFVRLLVLLAALVALIFALVISVIEIIVWPLLPPAVPVLIILGVI